MQNLILWLTCIIFINVQSKAWSDDSKPFVIADIYGQLGNQMFQIATATSLALDNDAEAIFPDLVSVNDYDIPANYALIFSKLKTDPSRDISTIHFEHLALVYSSINYYPDMKIRGHFQSWKYFDHHCGYIQDLFAPSQEILQYLHEQYEDIISDPHSVAVHIRTYNHADPDHLIYPLYGREYLLEAIKYFPRHSHFYIFSDDIEWCKKNLAGIPRQFHFIEGHYIHDFYLQTLCRHHIISNSTYSWWAAYLNRHPNKIVVAPKTWFQPSTMYTSGDIIPPEWITIPRMP